VAVVLLVEWSLPIPGSRSLNPAVSFFGTFYSFQSISEEN